MLALHLQDRKAFKKPQGSPFIVSEQLEKTYDFVQREERPSVIQTHVRESSNDRLWWHFERVKVALNQANDAVEASKCDHGLVQVSLLKIQSALEALGQELPKPKDNDQIRKHKRSTSVAYEALAFE